MSARSYPSTSSADLSDVNLSDREIEVLRLLILGCANKVIGRRLGICEATVKVHVKAALRKLRVDNRTQAAIWAVQRGLVGYDSGPGSAPSDDEDDHVEPPAFRIGNSRLPVAESPPPPAGGSRSPEPMHA